MIRDLPEMKYRGNDHKTSHTLEARSAQGYTKFGKEKWESYRRNGKIT